MGNLTLREAVKHYNVSRPTLTKALNSGKISGQKDDKGQWSISPAELSRVYQPRVTGAAKTSPREEANFASSNTVEHGEVERLKAALSLAESRAESAERLAQERLDRIEDLRRMLPPPTSETRKRWWWQRG